MLNETDTLRTLYEVDVGSKRRESITQYHAILARPFLSLFLQFFRLCLPDSNSLLFPLFFLRFLLCQLLIPLSIISVFAHQSCFPSFSCSLYNILDSKFAVISSGQPGRGACGTSSAGRCNKGDLISLRMGPGLKYNNFFILYFLLSICSLIHSFCSLPSLSCMLIGISTPFAASGAQTECTSFSAGITLRQRQ